MLCRQYVDEVKLRLTRIGVTVDLSDSEIITYINRARRSVQMVVLPIFEQRFGAFISIPLTNAAQDVMSTVPANYTGEPVNIFRTNIPILIDVISAYITWTDPNGIIKRREARRVSKKEMHTINNHSWNLPSIDRPVYAIEMKTLEATPGQTGGWAIYLGGLEDTPTTTILTQANPTFELWYTAPLADFQSLNEMENILSPDLEELAILQTMLYCLSNIEYIALKQSVQIDYELFKDVALGNYDMLRNKPIHVLPSEEGM